MANQKELDKCYMEVAKAHAALSKGNRAKVGACLVTQNGVVLGGCNGCEIMNDKQSAENMWKTVEFLQSL